jgi:hypothetical protein
MPNEDVFKGARSALTFLFAYQNAVAQEIGIERAIALQTRLSESMGARQGKMLKEQSGIKESDAKAALSLVKSLKESLGMTYEIVEENPQRVVIRTVRCPFFEAARMLGMDAKAIETGCRNGPMKMADSVVKQVNPGLNVRVRKFRSTPDGFCDEEIALS